MRTWDPISDRFVLRDLRTLRDVAFWGYCYPDVTADMLGMYCCFTFPFLSFAGSVVSGNPY